MMARSFEARCQQLIEAYRTASDVCIEDALVATQARRAAEIARRLGPAAGLLAMPDPVGTGKTVMALAAAAVLVQQRKVHHVVAIAPSQAVASLWQERAEQLNGAIDDPPFGIVRGAAPRLRWMQGELRVATRRQLTNGSAPRPSPSTTLVIVDEAHRGLQNDGAFRAEFDAWARDMRVLLVSATPFQLSSSGLVRMLQVSQGDNRRTVQLGSSVSAYGSQLVRLTRFCSSARDEGRSATDIEADGEAQRLTDEANRLAEKARSSIDKVVLPPDAYFASLPHHPRPVHLGHSDDRGAASEPVVPLGDAATAYHVARAVPELLNVGKGDMFNRELDSSIEAFWSSTAGQALGNPSEQDLEDAGLDPAATSRLAEELDAALGKGRAHPKIDATVSWVAERVRDGRHVLVFCVFNATREALETCLAEELGEAAVASPSGSTISARQLQRFRERPNGPGDAMALVVQDRFSESIDLDGGHPCLVHHDLSWNPARLAQRWGRVVRAGSGFTPVAPEDIFIPVLDTEVSRRLYETVRGRWEIGDILLPGSTEPHGPDDGAGAIPDGLLRSIAEVWQHE